MALVAPLFDTLGAGQQPSGTNALISFAHPTMGAQANCLLVGLVGQNSAFTGTMKVGATTVPLLNSYPYLASSWLNWYGLMFPPGTFAGPQAISMQTSSASANYYTVNSIAYSGVTSISQLQAAASVAGTNPLSHTINGVVGLGQVLVEAMTFNAAAGGQAFSAFNGTQRWNAACIAGQSEPMLIGETTPGAATNNPVFSANMPAAYAWGAMAVQLNGSGFALPAAFNPGDVYSNAHVNAVAAALNTIVNNAAIGQVAVQEATTSGAYADLPTTTDFATVNVGSSGAVLVILSAVIVTGSGYQAICSFALSGANTIAAGAGQPLDAQSGSGNLVVGNSTVSLLRGLAPGLTTFKMKYATGGGTAYFSSRQIIVIPLP